MNEKKAKELTDSIFNKLNDQERVYLAWIHNQKNKEIQKLKELLEDERLNKEIAQGHKKEVQDIEIQERKEIERLKEELNKLNAELQKYKSIVYLCEKVKDCDKE